ncbi:MAG: TylF/MycF/NovP-related O-methyltransferase [Ginsengibacter sp.]
MIKKLKDWLFTLTDANIRRIKSEGLSYLNKGALLEMKKVVKRIESRKVPGIFVETGCALGGSALLISLNKKTTRQFFVYDVFSMIPAPSQKDGSDVIERYETIKSGKSKGINNKKYYGYEENLKAKVENTFSEYGVDVNTNNVKLIEGLYEDTLRINEKVAFAHIDCDWYESVMICLVQIAPNLSTGGVIIIDDYYSWSGCKTATDEYFASKNNQFRLSNKANKLHVERIN